MTTTTAPQQTTETIVRLDPQDAQAIIGDLCAAIGAMPVGDATQDEEMESYARMAHAGRSLTALAEALIPYTRAWYDGVPYPQKPLAENVEELREIIRVELSPHDVPPEVESALSGATLHDLVYALYQAVKLFDLPHIYDLQTQKGRESISHELYVLADIAHALSTAAGQFGAYTARRAHDAQKLFGRTPQAQGGAQ